MRSSTLLLLALAGLSATPTAKATNFLVIVLDDLGADKVSSYRDEMYPGYSPTYLPETPNIDALASAGLRFSNAYANPVCSPTRASIMTGQYPFQHDIGAIINSTAPELDPDGTSLADMLDATAGGYESSLFGKWHLGTTSVNDSDWTTVGEKVDAVAVARHGFDAYAGNLDGQVEDYYDWLETRWPVTLSSGVTGSVITERFDWATDPTITDAADWIALQDGNWLSVVNLNAPHLDEEGEDNVWETDDLAPEDGGTCVDVNGNGRCNTAENYYTLVQDADERVQWLLEDLQAADPALLADTIIIFSGDNGTPKVLVEAPWTVAGERTETGKNTAYETGARIPFIIARGCDWMDLQDGALDGYLDGIEPACAGSSVDLVSPGLTIDLPVQVEDIFATVAELSGSTADIPSASLSLAPCLTATAADADDCSYADGLNRPIYTEKFSRPYSAASAYGTTGPASTGVAGLKVGTNKLIVNVGSSGGSICVGYEFYDLATDPFETDNLRSGAAMTAEQQAAYDATWLTLRTTIAPDWFPQKQCTSDSMWDTDHDYYEDSAHGGGDCDDTDPTVNIGATEVWYDGVDQDCAGDDDFDKDGDGYQASTYGGTDCNDTNDAVYPGATDTWYDGVDSNCDGADDYDRDADGYPSSSYGGGDCNDTNASVRPGISESCNGVDDNCNGSTDEGITSTYYRDVDGDNYGNSALSTSSCSQPTGYVSARNDCNDANAAVNPGATETCNSTDDDCDGSTDEGVRTTYYRDADSDGYGSSTVTSAACSQPAGYVTNRTDCNDANSSVNPGRTETCNGVDDNCSGAIDEGVKITYYRDADGDSYGTSSTSTQACTKPGGYVVNSTDCNDSSASVNPGASETCNSVDDNCSGAVDEGVTTTYYRDADSDGYGTSTSTTQACTLPSGYATSTTDCNDASATTYPGAPEAWYDGVDQNCDGASDYDQDGDTYPATAYGGTDCNDTNAAVKPGATDTWYDGVDQNCDGRNDYDQDNDGASAAAYGGTDCNDTNSTVAPGATETWYDGVDQDCSGGSDYDQDGDGATAALFGGTDCDDTSASFGPSVAEIWYDGVDQDCDGGDDYDQDGDGVPAAAYGGADCDDTNAAVNPYAAEIWYDGVDQDCSGGSDHDQDGDGADTTAQGGADCDDLDASVGPAAAEVWYDGVDQDCSGGSDHDQDGDGADTVAAGGDDCVDTNPAIGPTATEIWYDGVDQDCDGGDDFDQDGDGDALPAGGGADCDDGDASVSSLATETWYDGVDQDCLGDDDYDQDGDGEALAEIGGTDCDDTDATVNTVAGDTWYDGVDQDCAGDDDYDQDGDGEALIDFGGTDCDDLDPTVGAGAEELWYDGIDQDCAGDDDYDQDGDTFVSLDWEGDDCDDTDALIGPGMPEVLDDGIDQDCDGVDAVTAPADDDADGYPVTTDCDDLDPTIHPGASEIWYDGVDQDCSGGSDADQDGDGVTATAAGGTDCNDTNAAVKPGATETWYDGVDQNCDGASDYDQDGDGVGSSAYAGTDCDDTNAAVKPGATETWYDGVDQNCDGASDYDQDGDGVGSSSYGGTDCDDTTAAVRPGATETCNGIDDNCAGGADEGVTTTYYRDADTDGFGSSTTTSAACSQPAGYVTNSSDCNDASASVSPAATETCNNVDDDCDGSTDEGVRTTYYRDADADGYGTSSVSTQACTRPGGYSTSGTDCNDASAGVNPGARETWYDGVDQNCDGRNDYDRDGDGYSSSSYGGTDCNDTNAAINPAAAEVWYNGIDNNCDGRNDFDQDGDGVASSSYGGTDCNDTSATISPSAAETCDGVDNDCDGSVDDGVLSTWYADADADGYGSTSASTQACSQPSGYLSTGTDCNDASSAVNPAATETCNSTDDDCDGSTDEGVTTTYYRDADGDGYGTSSTTTQACSLPSGYTTSATDCNDGSASIKPGVPEVWYDGVDQNCDGRSDYDQDGDGYTATAYGGTDCNDTNSRIKPGALETKADGVDSNCNGNDNT